MILARRKLLGLAGFAPLAMAASTRALAEGATCYDANALPLSQKNMRRSLGYMDSSNDPAKRCGLCAFYAAGSGDCGKCQLLANGPVNAGALCASYAAKSR